MTSALKSWLSPTRPKGKTVVLQAVEEGSGEVVGWAAWAGVGVGVTLPSPGGVNQHPEKTDSRNDREEEELS